jgi:hypothetical protein
MLGAQARRDYARVADFAHPAAVADLGGREQMLARMRAQVKELDDSGAKWLTTSIGPATQVVSEGGTTYVVLPTRTVWTFQGREKSGISYVLGVSTDAGKTWVFADGVGLMHAETRRKLFPSLPPSLRLPVPLVPGFTAPP